MRKSPPRGLTLIEIGVVLGILALLLAISVPSYLKYRAHQAVNRAVETAEGLSVRAKEEARASGFALPANLRQAGLTQSALGGPQISQGPLAVRIRKRFRAGEPPQVVALRELSTTSLEYETARLGLLDLDADSSLEGVYLELLDAGKAVAVIPVDSSGEFILQGTENSAALSFAQADYRRSLELTRRGVTRPDRR